MVLFSLALVLVFSLAGCLSQQVPSPGNSGAWSAKSPLAQLSATSASAFAGSWSADSELLLYDEGESSAPRPPPDQLNLEPGGTWVFGGNKGTWEFTTIESGDWERWHWTAPRDSKLKLVFVNWNGDAADGPVVFSESRNVDFFWVVYRVGPPAIESPATVQIRFGKVR